MKGKRTKRGAKGATVSGQFDCYDRGGHLVTTVTLKPRSARGVNGAALKSESVYARMTDRARTVIARSREEAARLGDDFVGTEHLLLAMMEDRSSFAAGVLKNLGVCFCKVEAEVKRLLDEDKKR